MSPGKAWQAAREAALHAVEYRVVYVDRSLSRLTERMIEDSGEQVVVSRVGQTSLNRIEVVR